MAKATFVKCARKDVPNSDIKKGESYYWWKFRFGGRHVSRTAPRPSQLTQSEFLSTQLEIEERINNLSCDTLEDLIAERDDLVSEIRTLGEAQQEKHDNMPEGLQDGDTGQLLDDRASSCEEWASELEGVDIPDEDQVRADADHDEPVKDESEKDKLAREERNKEAEDSAVEEALETALNDIQGCQYSGE